MGSAANFCAAVANLHHEMEKNIIDKIQILLEEILTVEKHTLLGKIQILVERETTDPSSSLQWQLENNMVQFQCHSCSKTFPTNKSEAHHLKSESMSNEDFTGDDFIEDNLFEYSSEEQLPEDTFNEDINARRNLSSSISDVSSSSSNQMNTEGQLTGDTREEDIINNSKDIPVFPDKERNSNEDFSCPFLNCTYTHPEFPILMKHTLQNHVGEKLVCPKRAGKYYRGVKSQMGIPRKCKYCKTEIPLNQAMHFKTCNPQPDPRGKYKCKGCLQRFKSRRIMVRHRKNCALTVKLKCTSEACNKTFISSKGRRSHIKAVHPKD